MRIPFERAHAILLLIFVVLLLGAATFVAVVS